MPTPTRSTHTPGPWKQPTCYSPSDGHNVPAGRIEGPNGEFIAVVCLADVPTNAEWAANARVIEAAPDLLALVRQLGNIAGDRGLREDILSGMRPHEAATMQKLCDDAAALLAQLDGAK